MNKLNLSIDLGNRQVKIFSPKGKEHVEVKLVHPSSLLVKHDVPESSLTMNLADEEMPKTKVFQLLNDPIDYIWGDSLTQFHKSDKILESIADSGRYETNEYRLLSKFSMAEGIIESGIERDNGLNLDIAVALPDADYNAMESDNFSIIGNIFKGPQSVIVDGETINFEVNEVKVSPQGVGTPMNMLIDNSGKIADKELLKEKVGVIDLGGGTTNLTTLVNFQPDLTASATYWDGSNSLFKEIQQLVNGRQGVLIDMNELENIIKTGSFTYEINKSHSISFKDEYDQIISQRLTSLRNQVQRVFRNVQEYDRLVFTGGGVKLFEKKDLIALFGFGDVAKDGEMANAMGFYKTLNL